MSLTFGELFAGIGGFSLGLERAGMTCKWQVEIDPYATAVLKKHWPQVPKWDDVRTFPPQGDYAVDLICGGFPCQDISFAGNGAGLAGERSGLWYEFARVISELRPRYVLVENVAALLTRGMGDVVGTLASLGYDAEWHVIPASAVGAPHRRDRVWIIAQRSDTSCVCRPGYCRPCNGLKGDGEAKEEEGRRRVSRDAGGVGDSVPNSNRRRLHRVEADSRNGGTVSQKGAQREFCGSGRSDDVADATHIRNGGEDDDAERQESHSQVGLSQQLERSSCDDNRHRSEWWSVEPDVGRVAHGVPSRVDRLRCLGNAVVPQVVEVIGRAILEAEARMTA
jgi:DNA (cytosine-5)-methyltransferase 1